MAVLAVRHKVRFLWEYERHIKRKGIYIYVLCPIRTALEVMKFFPTIQYADFSRTGLF